MAVLEFFLGGHLEIEIKNNNNKNKTKIYLVINQKKTKKQNKTKRSQIHKMLQYSFMSFHILKSLHDNSLSIVIIYCQCR